MNRPVEEAPEAQLYASSAAVYLDDFGKPEVALQYYRKALELGHSEAVCLDGLARCYMKLGDHEQAFILYSRYVEAGYFSIKMSINYAFLLIQHGKPESALECLQRASDASTDPDVRTQLQKYLDYTRRIIDSTLARRAADRIFDDYVARSLPILRALQRPQLVPAGTHDAEGCAVITELREHP